MPEMFLYVFNNNLNSFFYQKLIDYCILSYYFFMREGKHSIPVRKRIAERFMKCEIYV